MAANGSLREIGSKAERMGAAGKAAKTRNEIRCERCGYGAVVERKPPRCPMCGDEGWIVVGGDAAQQSTQS
jgi:rubrerythrin